MTKVCAHCGRTCGDRAGGYAGLALAALGTVVVAVAFVLLDGLLHPEDQG